MDNILTITITVTTQCNYSCKYCFSNNKKNQITNYIEFNLLKIFLDHFITIYNTYKIRLILIGGEPFLYKDLYEFCKYFNRCNISIIICSNNSENALRYVRLYQLNSNIHYIFSWHSTKKDKLNKNFISNLKIFQKLLPSTSYEILVSAEPYNFDNSLFIYNYIISNFNNIQCEFNLLTGTVNCDIKYTQQQYDVIQKLSQKYDFQCYEYMQYKYKKLIINEIILNNKFDYYNWKCDAGKTYLYIDVEGFIYRCYSYYTHNKYISHISNINFNNLLLMNSQKCLMKKCSLDLTYTNKYYE